MSMKKVWIVAVFALAAVSCVRMEDISCDGVESVEVRSLGASRSLVEVSVRASNASGAAVSIVRADLTLDRGETTLLRASVDEKVRLPRRSEEATVRIPVEIRFEGGLLGALGLFIMAAGLFSLVLLPASPADINIIWPMILCGAGFGLFQSPNNHTIITSAPRERSGGASGMLGTARLLGQSSGAALVALMLNQFGDNGTHVSLIAAAILAVIAACVSGLRITQPRSRA